MITGSCVVVCKVDDGVGAVVAGGGVSVFVAAGLGVFVGALGVLVDIAVAVGSGVFVLAVVGLRCGATLGTICGVGTKGAGAQAARAPRMTSDNAMLYTTERDEFMMQSLLWKEPARCSQ